MIILLIQSLDKTFPDPCFYGLEGNDIDRKEAKFQIY